MPHDFSDLPLWEARAGLYPAPCGPQAAFTIIISGCYWSIPFSGSQLAEQIHICIHTNLCLYRNLSVFLSVAICICMKPNMSVCWCLQPSSVTRWIVLASSTCLPVNFTIPWIHCSFSVYLYSGIRIVNPHPVGKKLHQLEHSVYGQILLPLVLQIPIIPNYLVQRLSAPAPTFFPEIVSYIRSTVRLFCYILHFTLGSSNLLSYFCFICTH